MYRFAEVLQSGALLGKDVLKVGELAGNHVPRRRSATALAVDTTKKRQRIESCLFERVDYKGEVVLLDDSTISGATFRAMANAMPNACIVGEVALYGF